MNIREIHETDAAAFLELMHSIDEESPFAVLKPGERKTTVAEQRDEIRALMVHDNRKIFIAEDGAELIGWVGAWGERFERVRHSVWLSVAVRQDYRRLGIGMQLFGKLESWAWQREIRRMELQVAATNLPAIRLYLKAGFQIEGTRREAYFTGDEFIDEYLMARLLKAPEPPKNLYPKW
ncbi:MAG: GNAT family N-acetyltransferase [Bacteroidia bacterium]|nr:GNAT family N-acetyltransferase [Bacteroidia bacterium]